MDLNPYVVLGSAVVGLLVGLTGAGGGALMTPMLILLFNAKPAAAISSDLVAAVVMRPVGSAVHIQRGTVNFRLVGWMCLGSVPMAFLGAYLLHVLGGSSASQQNVEIALGAALLAGTAAMVVRYWLDRRSGQQRSGAIAAIRVRPLPTVAIGIVGGLIVGMTSVGSGSLMIVLLLFTYPMLAAGQLVGTRLTPAARPLDHRQRARRAHRFPALVPGAGQVHPAGHHLRDLRLRAEVRRHGHDDPRLDLVRRAAGRRGLLAMAQQQEEQGGTPPPAARGGPL